MGLTRPRAHQLQDIDYKQTSRAITTTNITLSGGAPAVVDGVSLALNDRVLVTGQSTGSENGIYSVTTVGAGSNGTWARSSDADGAGEIKAGSIIMVTEGTVNADTQWKLTTDDPITIGSTALTFARNGNNAYGVFAVAGQSDIVADGVGDTLTVVAGTNIALTTNASTDTLTVTPSLTPALTTLVVAGLTYPTADGTNGQVLQTDGSGTLSFADASGGGATVSSDTTTNAERLIYVGSTTTGTLSAVTQDSGLTYNPSSGTLTSAEFVGGGAGLTGLNGSNIASGTIASARVAGAYTGITSVGTLTGFTSTGIDDNADATAITIDSSENVGIGTSSPSALIHGNGSSVSALLLTTNSYTSGTEFKVQGDGSSYIYNKQNAMLRFGTNNLERIRIDSSGNVGIGTASPSTKLHVVGDITVSGTMLGVASSITSQANSATIGAGTSNTPGNIVLRDGSGNFSAGVITATATAARYADLAEKYASDEDYDPGTVVELGGTAEVTQTRRPTSLAIAGIVSTDPAYLMNSDSEGISVALIGRVPCKVTGKINKGDILVSSDIPGHAKAHREIHNPPAGSMIGKAIEAKDDNGLGFIEVLVGRM